MRQVVTILIAAAAAAYLVFMMPLPFVSTWWRDSEDDWGDPFNRRHRMADWLLLSRQLPGPSKDEIIARLGPTTNTSYFSRHDMVFLLGQERGLMAIDSEWLVIDLDDGGKSISAQIVRD